MKKHKPKPAIKQETVEEFLARGGQIKILEEKNPLFVPRQFKLKKKLYLKRIGKKRRKP